VNVCQSISLENVCECGVIGVGMSCHEQVQCSVQSVVSTFLTRKVLTRTD
jgi:hypothetical protein